MSDQTAPVDNSEVQEIARNLTPVQRSALEELASKKIMPLTDVSDALATLTGLWLASDGVALITRLGELVADEMNFMEITGEYDEESSTPAAPDHIVQPDKMVDQTPQIDLQPAPDPLDDMDADQLRAQLRLLQVFVITNTTLIADQRAKMVVLQTERDEFDSIAKAALGDKVRAERELNNLRDEFTAMSERTAAANYMVDNLNTSLAAAVQSEIKAKAAAAEALIRAVAAERRLEEVTASRPDGHVIALNITQPELDNYLGEGRLITHLQFMPNNALNAVIGPRPVQPSVTGESVQPSVESDPAYTPPSSFYIPKTPSIWPPTRTPYRPYSPPAYGPQPSASAVIIAPQPPTSRVPTFPEILSARLSGQITADQFTRYSNALAGHNAAQHTGAMRP